MMMQRASPRLELDRGGRGEAGDGEDADADGTGTSRSSWNGGGVTSGAACSSQLALVAGESG